jgi:hypothetical protein
MAARVLYTVFFLLLLVVAVLFTTILSPENAYGATTCSTGAGGFVPLECFDDSQKLKGAYTEGNFSKFLNRVFMGAISLGAILAFLRLAWAGFRYMSSDLPGVKGNAKETINDVFLGLFLLLAIWIILWQINPQILSLKISETNIDGSTSAADYEDADFFPASGSGPQPIGAQSFDTAGFTKIDTYIQDVNVPQVPTLPSSSANPPNQPTSAPLEPARSDPFDATEAPPPPQWCAATPGSSLLGISPSGCYSTQAECAAEKSWYQSCYQQ